jgi:hypothetical protein
MPALLLSRYEANGSGSAFENVLLPLGLLIGGLGARGKRALFFVSTE